jgi:hypothetical protein
MISILFKKNKAVVIAAFAMTLCACASQAQNEEAALLPANSTQARAEIIKLISQSLGGKNIPVALDVFQHSSKLLLGKVGVTSPSGIKVLDADKHTALVFELVKQGEDCLLIRKNTSQKWKLKTTSCFKG